MPNMSQQLVRGFAGENRTLDDNMLPDNVSPDAQNCEYDSGTIRKRSGFERLHSTAILDGGVTIGTGLYAEAKHLAAYNPETGQFTVECFVRFKTTPDGDALLFSKSKTIGDGGWLLRYDSTANKLVGYASGTAARTLYSNQTVTLDTVYHVVMLRDADNVIRLYVNDVAGDTATDDGSITWTVGVIFGFSGITQSIQMDEFRIWSDARTTAEIAATRYRELNGDEIRDTNLVGYWRFNDAKWGIATDLSTNRNHATLRTGPSFEPGLLPLQEGAGHAIRFDGTTGYASAAYDAAYASILNTGSTWTIECMVRVDNPNFAADVTICHLGKNVYGATTNGYPFHLYIKTSTLELYVSRSTTTTDVNVATATGYVFTAGSPAHVAVTRNGTTMIVYVNGTVYATVSDVANENGPTNNTDTTNGMYFGCKYSDAAIVAGTYAPITIDEVRLWTTVRSSQQISDWMWRTFPDTKATGLVGYWRFDAEDKEHDETGNSDITLGGVASGPVWSEGLVYPHNPKKLLMVAPMSKPYQTNEVRTGKTPWDREVVIATHTDLWVQRSDQARKVYTMAVPGESPLFSYTFFSNKLIMCNGIENNLKYDGSEAPHNLCIATPTVGSWAGTATGTEGSIAAGTYTYRMTYRNSQDGTESYGSDSITVTVAEGNDTVAHANIPTSSDSQVDERRFYRMDPGSSVYRLAFTVHDNTSTSGSETLGSVASNEAINDYRGAADPAKWCEVYADRLWLLNGSTVYYSEAGYEGDFTPTNYITIDTGDGDDGTGLKAAYGGLLVFKRNSIHYLSGYGASTFNVRLVVRGVGCVSGHTIAETPQGLMFLGNGAIYLMTPDLNVTNIGDSQRELLDQITPEAAQYAVGVYNASENKYLLSFEVA